ncbi:hypothetical protein V6N13_048799 [Hibiscus sabdariffa]
MKGEKASSAVVALVRLDDHWNDGGYGFDEWRRGYHFPKTKRGKGKSKGLASSAALDAPEGLPERGSDDSNQAALGICRRGEICFSPFVLS